MHEIPTQAMRASNAKLIIRALGLQVTGFRAIKSMIPPHDRYESGRLLVGMPSAGEEACAERP
jgi:hypothetical protein